MIPSEIYNRFRLLCLSMIEVDTALFKLDQRTEQRILADFNYITKQYDNEKKKYETGERVAEVRSEKELG